MRQPNLDVEGGARLRECSPCRVNRPFTAIGGALLLSFCGGGVPTSDPPAEGPDRDTTSTSALTVFTIPGRVESEAFTGFSGSTTSSKGGTGTYGNLQPCSDASGCGQNVGWIGAGEWFSYDVQMQGSVASIDVRVASPYSGYFHLDVDDGAFKTALLNVATGGWQRWMTVTTALPLASGRHVVKLVADTGAFNVNYLDFESAPTGAAHFYNGCYRDDAQRALDIFKGSRPDMTPQLCQRLCADHHYAGVQWHSQCWCGDSLGGYDLRPDGECNTPCSGDPTQMCGGGWRNSVYFVPTHLGCYSDSSTRALPVFKGYSYGMAPQKCQALCDGYAYAGLQWHGQCWCGNTLGDELRPNSECNTACNGDSTQTCGGGWRNSIYSLGDPCYGCWDY